METISVFIAHHMGLTYLFAATLVALMIVEALRAKRTQVLVAAPQAVTLINRNNAVVIDIRDNAQYKAGHIIDAVSLPLQPIAEASKKLEKYKNKPLILVCQNGTESQKAAATLKNAGFNAVAITGGLRSWSESDLPLVKG